MVKPFLIPLLAFVGGLVHGAEVDILATASNGFSQSLYTELAASETNLVYSPYSIHSCLTMTSVGANGGTLREMNLTLGLDNVKAPHQAYHDLIVSMNSVKEVKLNTANALFMNPSMPIETSFVQNVERDYFASSGNFDLAAPEGPEKVINDFVTNKTEGIIKDIIPAGSIDGDTVMILVNTVFFNGTWETQFEDYKTRPDDFQQLGGTKVQVQMMHDNRYVDIKRNVYGADVARLPFKGGRFSLLVALPQKTDGITDLETQLTDAAKVSELFQDLQPTHVQLAIPKFKIETELELSTALKNLGMVEAFDPNQADFSGITPLDKAFISSVRHKAMIEVKETGTVAAAATTVQIQIESVELPPKDAFIADHPFIFYLLDNTTGNILFQGKYSG